MEGSEVELGGAGWRNVETSGIRWSEVESTHTHTHTCTHTQMHVHVMDLCRFVDERERKLVRYKGSSAQEKFMICKLWSGY